jgi:hypothetical protein
VRGRCKNCTLLAKKEYSLYFQVSIADITLGVDLTNLPAGMAPHVSGLKVEMPYNKFVVSRPDPVAILLKPSESLPKKKYTHTFDSSALWVLHHNGRKDFRVEFHRGFGGPAVAFVDVDLNKREGTVFYTEDGLRDAGTGFLPFVHPVDGVIFINLLPSWNGILLHACGVDDRGRGYLFAGRSGDGKSTTATLWDGEAGVKVLSDERIIVREIEEKFYAYGTPWHGEVEVGDPGRLEVEEVFFLRHAERNYTKKLSPEDAAGRIFARCLPTFWDKEGIAQSLSLIERIVKKVPCYEFGFVPDKGAVSFVRHF